MCVYDHDSHVGSYALRPAVTYATIGSKYDALNDDDDDDNDDGERGPAISDAFADGRNDWYASVRGIGCE
jgi:hypothetical protein